ncbi:hypothetical protein [Pedobacter jeongneungensis]|uniref:hypothetical protein n=1 Tax=Pedobacter jeongneungensis TaxID=947309 RepID=UPI0013B43412|nr:hypothetical protein [Pedobacter jeongneungensis]
MLHQSSNEPLLNLMRIKKTAALCFVFNTFFKKNPSKMNTKPLRFRFGAANLPKLQLFFLISPALGIDSVLG